MLAAIAAVFGFVYWLHNTGGLGRARRLSRPVRGLGVGPAGRRGRAVQRHPRRRGDRSRARPRQSAPGARRRSRSPPATPVRADTKVGLEFQGLTGVAVIALNGGNPAASAAGREPAAQPPLIAADPIAGQSMTQAARTVLQRLDTILAENSDRLEKHDRQFQDVLGGAGAQFRQGRRHRRRPRTDDRRRRGRGAIGDLRPDRAARLSRRRASRRRGSSRSPSRPRADVRHPEDPGAAEDPGQPDIRDGALERQPAQADPGEDRAELRELEIPRPRSRGRLDGLNSRLSAADRNPLVRDFDRAGAAAVVELSAKVLGEDGRIKGIARVPQRAADQGHRRGRAPRRGSTRRSARSRRNW